MQDYQIPFDVLASCGSLPDWETVNKFGRCPNGAQLTATDVWDRADATPTQQIWVPPTQARIHALISTDINDSGTGGVNPESTGTRTVRVYGLTSWHSKETSEVVALDGTTAVNTSNAYVIIHRIEQLTAGTTGKNEGVITATAATDGTVTAQINASKAQTQMAIYGVPSIQTAYMTAYYSSIHDAKTPAQSAFADVTLLVNPEPENNLTSFIVKHTQGVSTFGNSYLRHPFNPKYKIQGPAIIKMQMIASGADIDVSAGFDMFLKDKL